MFLAVLYWKLIIFINLKWKMLNNIYKILNTTLHNSTGKLVLLYCVNDVTQEISSGEMSIWSLKNLHLLKPDAAPRGDSSYIDVFNCDAVRQIIAVKLRVLSHHRQINLLFKVPTYSLSLFIQTKHKLDLWLFKA